MENLTYPLDERGSKPIYVFLYERIKNDILQGIIPAGEKLPSKRSMASHLGIAIITVENAYALLELEGYIVTIKKKGYYVSSDISISLADTMQKKDLEKGVSYDKAIVNKSPQQNTQRKKYLVDFTTSNGGNDGFPFSAWAKLSRKVLLDNESSFLEAPEGQGVYCLRKAIADYLYKEKGISTSPDNIIIGPGTEYLHHILIQLLGRNIFVAVEDPGYQKVGRIYQSNGVKLIYIPVDKKGMKIDILHDSNVKLVHTSPSHHFPTGYVMTADRRQKLLLWAKEQEAFVIEDDYDSEFRFDGRPISTLYAMNSEKVIYMNTFTRSLAPSIRIAYMILPDELMKKYESKLFFYSGTVSSFDQYTLAAFINEGYYERHIRRVRNKFKEYRNNLLWAIKESGLGEYITIYEDLAGFHMTFEIKKEVNRKKFINFLEKKDIKISTLDIYSYNSGFDYVNKYLLCYGNQDKYVLLEAMSIIKNALRGQ